jgi:hypothetical protein
MYAPLVSPPFRLYKLTALTHRLLYNGPGDGSTYTDNELGFGLAATIPICPYTQYKLTFAANLTLATAADLQQTCTLQVFMYDNDFNSLIRPVGMELVATADQPDYQTYEVDFDALVSTQLFFEIQNYPTDSQGNYGCHGNLTLENFVIAGQ